MVFHWFNRWISSTYFIAGIIGANGQIKEHKVIRGECKRFGKALIWKKGKNEQYGINTRRFKRKGGNPYGMWVEGRPPQLELGWDFTNAQEYIQNNKIKHFIESSTELDDVADNKITHDAFRYTLGKLDWLHIALLCVAIVINIVAVYYIYEANNASNVIINYLNQLIQSKVLPPPAGVG